LSALALTALVTCTAPGATAAPAAPAPSGAATVAAPQLRAGQKTTVTYCNHQQAKVTEPTKLPGPAPAVVYVHGGSWVSGNYNTGGFLISGIGPALASKGFVVVAIDYRLGPKAQWPDQIEDLKCAIRYLRANARALNLDPNEIGAWGQSAGGHLVDLLGTAGPGAGWDVGAYPHESSRVEAVVDMAGPTDLLTLGNQGASPVVLKSFLSLLPKARPKKIRAELKEDSPVTHVSPGDPPFMLLHSDNDEIVYPQQSQEFAWDLAANKVPFQFVMVQGGGHEFDQADESPDMSQITVQVIEFFVEVLAFHQVPTG